MQRQSSQFRDSHTKLIFFLGRFSADFEKQLLGLKLLTWEFWKLKKKSSPFTGQFIVNKKSHDITNRFKTQNRWYFVWDIHLFAGRAFKRKRRKGSSRRQQTTYGAAVNEVARELLRSARSPKRENGDRRYIKHDRTIASPVGSCLCCWQLPLSPPVPPLSCSAPHCLSLSLSHQVWCIQRCDCVKCTYYATNSRRATAASKLSASSLWIFPMTYSFSRVLVGRLVRLI